MHKITIAIDGFSGTGKSSTAKKVAGELGYTYIDSGAMYRATTLYFLEQDVSLDDASQVEHALDTLDIRFEEGHVLLNGLDVSNEIRTMRVNEHVSAVSTIAVVRHAMVAQQQKIGKGKGIVMDGRDIGTVVFPGAELKVFMTADTRIRAERRQSELAEKGIIEELNVIENNLSQRDEIDSTRSESPLRKAEDAVEIDTSNLTFADQVHKIVSLAKEKIHAS
ncbi:(d)CMP kinase [Marinoscillum sp. 108]|uniref:(d)CMP kinase n=1 Tax=Marinoscillum sp. 108 TaxID=2653151 RepID=UPI0012F080CC|nr:(d)CMP kinase [Marinoscillum sp. 108]VXD15908.1 Cytidylate kinase [Marinoscillum sp. 108]